MKKSFVIVLLSLMTIAMAACGAKDTAPTEPLPTAPEATEDEPKLETPTEDVTIIKEPEETTVKEDVTVAEVDDTALITEDQALSAVISYCYEENSGLKDMVLSNDYTIFWDVESCNDTQIVILYRSYTAAIVRFYIDRESGQTYTTEFVSGITEEEEKTDVSFNIKDYIKKNELYSTGNPVDGTWATASIGYTGEDGKLQPEEYVRFGANEIYYGHMNGDNFEIMYTDRIDSVEYVSTGIVKIKAESMIGVQYTYMTCESDPDILEYYDTWDDDKFPEMYRAGASLTRCK